MSGDYTNGPWRWSGGTLEQDVPDNNGDIILGLYDEGCTHIDNDADKALIAAAPDLLEALKRMHQAFNAKEPIPSHEGAALEAMCRAVIAKAEDIVAGGEQDKP